MTRALYFVVASLFVVFGVLAILSIGFPFFAIGTAMLVLTPFRGRPAVFWPALGAVIAFFVGYVVVAPMTCTAQETVVEGAGDPAGTLGRTTCENLLGFAYSGTDTYDPPLWPAVLVGVLLAATVAIALRRVLSRRATADDQGPPPPARGTS